MANVFKSIKTEHETEGVSEVSDSEICLMPVMAMGRVKADPELDNLTVDGNWACVPHLVKTHDQIPAVLTFQKTIKMTTK